jgi:hypothetical protein
VRRYPRRWDHELIAGACCADWGLKEVTVRLSPKKRRAIAYIAERPNRANSGNQLVPIIWHHSPLMFAALMIGHHLSISVF